MLRRAAPENTGVANTSAVHIELLQPRA